MQVDMCLLFYIMCVLETAQDPLYHVSCIPCHPNNAFTHTLYVIIQVRDVIGYAVGETVSGRSAGGRRSSSREGQKVLAVEEGSLVASPVEEVAGRHGDEQEVAHYQPRQSCYEVVTAWVHPK